MTMLELVSLVASQQAFYGFSRLLAPYVDRLEQRDKEMVDR